MYCYELPPVVTLKNGLRVANFSSPHSFRFVDGSELYACSPERANFLKLEAVEEERESTIPGVIDIELSFLMTQEVYCELRHLNKREDIDIILVPFPVMESIRFADVHTQMVNGFVHYGKCRVCRTANRVTKEIYDNKFCI